MSISKVSDLNVYSIAFELAMKIYRLSFTFPKEEKYSLTDQIRRSSRSISINIAEGWGKRIYVQVFKCHLIDSLGSLEETKGWLEYSKECEYMTEEEFYDLYMNYDKLGAMVFKLHENWKGSEEDRGQR